VAYVVGRSPAEVRRLVAAGLNTLDGELQRFSSKPS